MSISSLNDALREHKARYRKQWGQAILGERRRNPTDRDIHIDHDWLSVLVQEDRDFHRAGAFRERAAGVKYRKRTYGNANG